MRSCDTIIPAAVQTGLSHLSFSRYSEAQLSNEHPLYYTRNNRVLVRSSIQLVSIVFQLSEISLFDSSPKNALFCRYLCERFFFNKYPVYWIQNKRNLVGSSIWFVLILFLFQNSKFFSFNSSRNNTLFYRYLCERFRINTLYIDLKINVIWLDRVYDSF